MTQSLMFLRTLNLVGTSENMHAANLVAFFFLLSSVHSGCADCVCGG